MSSKFAELSSTMQFMMDDIQATTATRFSNITELQLAFEKFKNATKVNYNGGIFNVLEPGLIGMVSGFASIGGNRIVLDSFSAPILITKPLEFLNKLVEAYDTAIAEYSESFKLYNRK